MLRFLLNEKVIIKVLLTHEYSPFMRGKKTLTTGSVCSLIMGLNLPARQCFTRIWTGQMHTQNLACFCIRKKVYTGFTFLFKPGHKFNLKMKINYFQIAQEV